ncbi:MAG TPA: hypothetical protein VMW93_05760 [bacterium]|nr:hypothetical protein [bacterium]
MATGDWGIEIMRQLFLVKADFGDLFGPNGELVGSQEEAFAKLEEILGGRFGGMMTSMMDTVQGKVSNLKDGFDALGAAVGAELTPITKEFLDLLIEVVKQAEESGELQDMARDIADAFRDNKDMLVEIVGLIPEMISLLAATGHAVADIVSKVAELNEAWGDWTGSGKTALAELDELLGILGGTLNMVGEVIRGSSWSRAREVGRSRQAGIGKEYREGESLIKTRPAGMRGFAEVGEAPSDVEALVREMKEQGYSPEDILFQARGTRAESRVEAILAPELPRGAAKKPGAAPKKRKEKYLPTVEKGLAGVDVLGPEELAAAESELAMAEVRAKHEAEREAELKKQQEEIRALAETYAEYLDPTSYIIAGLKSGEMGAAIQDFATSLGEKVAAELVHKLIVMGIMAILNIATGGATTPMQMAMARGGVIKAQGGLTMLPARPGGWTFPWAGKWINAAEGGRPEVLGVFPEGQRGRDLIMRELLPQFFPETQMVNRNTFSPNIDVTLRGTDPQSIGVAVRAEQGSVNRDHVQRRAA